jgi:microcystin-dependent protein/ribosomal protein L14
LDLSMKMSASLSKTIYVYNYKKTMKKLIAILLALSVSAPVFAYQNLWEYYIDTLGYMPSISERALTAEDNGIPNYAGTASQNELLLSALTTDMSLGGFRPSGYTGKLMTRLTQGGSETTLNTTPGTAPDGTSLTTAKIGDFIVLTINPGASNEEKISASAVSVTGTTATWTIINRGLSFTENTAVTANKKQHAIGETVIISNDDHYLSSQYPAKDENAVITGLWTFNAFPVTPTTSTSTETTAGYVEIATKAEAAAGTTLGGTSAPLVLPASMATSTSQVATTSVVVTNTSGKIADNFFATSTAGFTPAGSITGYVGSTSPSGWFLCDGTAYSTTTYAALYNVIGYKYSTSSNGALFQVPDLRGRSIVMASSTQTATSSYNRTYLGASGGVTTHTQTLGELAAHSHTIDVKDGTGHGPGPKDSDGWTSYSPSSNSAGGGTAFNILDPYLIVNYIIKY